MILRYKRVALAAVIFACIAATTGSVLKISDHTDAAFTATSMAVMFSMTALIFQTLASMAIAKELDKLKDEA